MLVNRRQRYDDLTPEGRALLPWAQQALAGLDGLNAEAARLRHSLTGTLHLGVIPTALSVVSLITEPLLARHPEVRVEVRSLSSIEIGRRLADRELDAGVTYLDNEPIGAVVATPVYRERYLFLTGGAQPRGETIGWSELRDVPLCLLTRDMQNRRIVDAALGHAGSKQPRAWRPTPSPRFSPSPAPAGPASWRTPGSPSKAFRPACAASPSPTPTSLTKVGVVTPQTELVHPIVRALLDELSTIDIDGALVQRRRAAQ